MNPYENLSPDERLTRIAELLSKAVTLYVLKQREKDRDTAVAEVAAKVETSKPDWITRGILDFLKRVGWATPRDIRRCLDVTRSTCCRRLHALTAQGVLETRGFTRGVQYRICGAVQRRGPAPAGLTPTPACQLACARRDERCDANLLTLRAVSLSSRGYAGTMLPIAHRTESPCRSSSNWRM